MTLAEFKAWFDGFTEDMEAVPNAKQWKRIKARVKEIDGSATTYPVFIDRYFPRWRTPYVSWLSTNAAEAAGGDSFNAADALYAKGKADFNQTVMAA